ncbi:MAG: hypothetical protein KAR38_00155, partial [Calditrichia bacterium]|nr:hypothetical protein [Calditrichia bacterium]
HLLSGGEDKFRAKAEVALTSVLNEVNKCSENKTLLGNISIYFDKDALADFKYLVNSTKLYALQKEYRTYLILTKSGDYEVRNIKVRIFMGGTKGIPFQNLVFIFNKECKIINVHFSLEDHHYQEIIEQGKKLNDLAYREKILHFIELYRTAYNKKDYEFIKKTLSDDALIIVGRVIKTKKQESDFLETSYLSDEKIEFIKLSKNEYLKRLKNVFKRNDFVKVLFDRINIKRHPKFDKIYGVQLKQRWHSSFYSDEGYLFLLVDFINEQEPIIHVRAWQPDKFTDGSTISIFDFEIIE